ncbi:MAG: PIN domain-containing protein [Pseudomonadota bacterium]
MKTNYVLIDFENVRPKNLEVLKRHPFKVLVFVGATQSRIPFDLAEAMQAMGESAQYLKISGTGSNALDFHLAYYLGEIASKEPSAVFHIVSKDKGFDPLLTHMRSRKIDAQRVNDLAEISVLRMSKETSNDEKIDSIVKNLVGRGQSRPRKAKTLANTIQALFSEKLSAGQLQSLIDTLEKKRYIAINNGNVSYRLPR